MTTQTASQMRANPRSKAVDIPAMMDADPGETPSVAEARAQVRALTSGHYENFSVLSRLVPEAYRDDFAAVYAFCRWSDDLADETGHGEAARERSLELLGRWRAELDDALAGNPRRAVFVALADTIERRGLRPEPMHRLIDAFEQDQRVTRYSTWDELIGYCDGSANPVGHMVLQLGGVCPPDQGAENERLYTMSDATCTALQLTNHWQDVRRDLLERDRVYLPSAETGLSAGDLRDLVGRGDDPAARLRYIRALRPLVVRADGLFDRGAALPGVLDQRELGWLAKIVWLLGAGGRRVLRKVEAGGCVTLWKRPTLSKLEKGLLIARGSITRPWRASKDGAG